MPGEIKFTALPTGSAIADADIVPWVQSGVNVKQPASALATYMQSQITFQNVYNSSSPPSFTLSSAGFSIKDPVSNFLFNITTFDGINFSTVLSAQNIISLSNVLTGNFTQFDGGSILNYVHSNVGAGNPNFTFTAQSDIPSSMFATAGTWTMGFSDESSSPSGFYKLNLKDGGSTNNILYASGTALGNISRVGINSQLTLGIDYGSPSNSNALLQLKSTSQGLLPPGMTTAQMNAIPVSDLDAGLMVYVTDLVNGYYYFDGTSWVYISNSGSSGNTLQAAYDAGNTISLATGRSILISNQSGLTNFIYLYSPGVPAPYSYDSLEGMQFTPNTDVYVTALQYVNQYFSSGARQVGIFRTSDQALIVSDLVYKTDPLDGSGNYRTHAINPVLLTAGVSYFVGAIVPAHENWTFYSISNPPDFNWTGISFGQSASVLVYPTSIVSTSGAVYGNQNFQYSTATSVISFNDGTSNSVISVNSTTQGFTPPVLTQTQETALLSIPLTSTDKGLQWFNYTTGTDNYWDGSALQQILTIQKINAGTNVTLDKSVPGQVTINASGGGVTPSPVYSSLSIQNNSVATTFAASNTFYPIYVGTIISGNDAADFTNQFMTISSVSTAVMTCNASVTQFYNVNINFGLRGAVPTMATYVASIYIRQAGGTIVATQYRNLLTLNDLINFDDLSITGNVQLATGDSVFVEIQNITNTNSVYAAYATYSIINMAGSISSTDGLPQGTNNLYLSQNGGTTYENVHYPVTSGNLAIFNSSTGDLFDFGFPASELITTVISMGGALSGTLPNPTLSASGINQVIAITQVSGTSQAMTDDAPINRYIIGNSSPTTLTLPVSMTIGHTIEIYGGTGSPWIIAQNGGQQIITTVGNSLTSTTPGVTGYAQASNFTDCVTLVYDRTGIFVISSSQTSGLGIILN